MHMGRFVIMFILPNLHTYFGKGPPLDARYVCSDGYDGLCGPSRRPIAGSDGSGHNSYSPGGCRAWMAAVAAWVAIIS